MAGNALQTFLHSAAAGQVDPVGKFFNYRQMQAMAEYRKRMAALKEAQLPIQQQEANTGSTNAALRGGELGLDIRKQGHAERVYSEEPGREDAKLDRRVFGSTYEKLDPTAQGQMLQNGLDPTQLESMQKGMNRRAAGRAGGIAEAQQSVGEKYFVRKEGLKGAIRGQDPTNPQNMMGGRQSNAAADTLSKQRDALERNIAQMDAKGTPYPPAQIAQMRASFDKHAAFVGQRHGFDPAALMYTRGATPTQAPPVGTSTSAVDEYLRGIK